MTTDVKIYDFDKETDHRGSGAFKTDAYADIVRHSKTHIGKGYAEVITCHTLGIC